MLLERMCNFLFTTHQVLHMSLRRSFIVISSLVLCSHLLFSVLFVSLGKRYASFPLWLWAFSLYLCQGLPWTPPSSAGRDPTALNSSVFGVDFTFFWPSEIVICPFSSFCFFWYEFCFIWLAYAWKVIFHPLIFSIPINNQSKSVQLPLTLCTW